MASVLLSVQLAAAQETDDSTLVQAEPIAREFRAAWIATVDNIDWPSEPGLPSDVQKAELVSLFDRAVALNLNAIILQVRPAADALYCSELEPWSEYLTGKMGMPPDPEYDPLRFAVIEAHKRGLELHAWFNPFRALHPSAEGPISPDHISQSRPDLVRSYGKQLWLDPGEADAVDHTLAVMLDVVERYDIDGIHIDDYFYPYPIKSDGGGDKQFPDDQSWTRARGAAEDLTRNDWRRSNVDRFVERLYHRVKATKKWVKVGISPFGIWRPGHPESVSGFDAYERLFADARRWVREGWLDYLTPQLYWSIDSKGQSYSDLLDWWSDQNSVGRHVWPGNFASRAMATGSRKWEPDEIVNQIRLTRESPEATGNVHFSMKSLLDTNGTLGDLLEETVYASPALIPSSPWLADEPPARPRASIVDVAPDGQTAANALSLEEDATTNLWAIRLERGGDVVLSILPGNERLIPLGANPNFGMPQNITIVAISRTGIESAPTHVEIPQPDTPR